MAQDFSFTATLGEDNQCVSSNGTIRIDVTEGNAPYVYKIDNGAFGDSNEFTTLSHGNHNVVIKDVNDCTIGLNITVPSGITGTSWSTEIKPLIQTYCALSGCHNGLSRPDLRLYSKAKFYAAEIKLFTQDKSMPFDGNLTQNQIEVIACWVDDGALEN